MGCGITAFFCEVSAGLELHRGLGLVKYSLKLFRSGQLIQGEIYLVIEIYIDFEREKTSYRIVSNTGCPAIYEANGFEIVSENLDGYY